MPRLFVQPITTCDDDNLTSPMNQKDLAYVLVKLMGFSWILLALFSSVSRTIELGTIAASNTTLGAAARGMSFGSLLTPVVQIVLALLVIKNADKIVQWLFGNDQT